MTTLIAATHNKDKLREFREIFHGWTIEAESPDIEETEDTFAGNAMLKARAISERHPGAWVLADDSGLSVDALGGAPGVFSARYAGRDGDNDANNALLLENLHGVENRAAHYSCAIALISPTGEEHVFEGRCDGRIAESPSGTGGFGYDPLFVPDGADKSFASFTPDEKNAISHRGKALGLVRQWLMDKGPDKGKGKIKDNATCAPAPAAHVATVGIVGRTNAGKSTLLNAIVGEKVSIVTPVAQTTRNSIRAILDERRGQLVFVDTPGLHKSESKLGNLINKMARHAAANVEMLLVVFDVSEEPQLEDDGWMRRILGAADDDRPVFFFLNKCDRDGARPEAFEARWADLQRELGVTRKARVFRGSAATGAGVEKLVSSLFDVAPPGERLYPPDILSDYPRQLAIADIIREKAFLLLRDEVPHNVGVRIDRFFGDGPKWTVEATLLVSRPSQKPIVIGPAGKTIKRIRVESQRDIEDQYGVRAKLDLWVKVDKDWTTNPLVLRQLGYLGDF